METEFYPSFPLPPHHLSSSFFNSYCVQVIPECGQQRLILKPFPDSTKISPKSHFVIYISMQEI